MSNESELLLVPKNKNLFFAYREISDIFTGLTHMLAVMDYELVY